MLSNFLFYQNVEQLPVTVSLKGVIGEARREKLGDEAEVEEELAFGFARE